MEEHPTEIFVRQEIPFDLALVGALLEEIRGQLETHADHSDNHLHNSLPELQVANLDDVTSCLTLLRDYAIAWSHDVTKNSSVLEEQLKRSGERATDLELQVKETISESESSESGLLEKLQVRPFSCREAAHSFISLSLPPSSLSPSPRTHGMSSERAGSSSIESRMRIPL